MSERDYEGTIWEAEQASAKLQADAVRVLRREGWNERDLVAFENALSEMDNSPRHQLLQRVSAGRFNRRQMAELIGLYL